MLSATFPPGRFGALDLKDGLVQSFKEKPQGDGAVINGGFFVLTPAIFDYLADDSSVWEQEPLSRLAEEGELAAFVHSGFWQPMDTLRDKQYLENLWQSGRAPWKVW
jgi:glucose-1-phosphate cytidylyltransferase